MNVLKRMTEVSIQGSYFHNMGVREGVRVQFPHARSALLDANFRPHPSPGQFFSFHNMVEFNINGSSPRLNISTSNSSFGINGFFHPSNVSHLFSNLITNSDSSNSCSSSSSYYNCCSSSSSLLSSPLGIQIRWKRGKRKRKPKRGDQDPQLKDMRKKDTPVIRLEDRVDSGPETPYSVSRNIRRHLKRLTENETYHHTRRRTKDFTYHQKHRMLRCAGLTHDFAGTKGF